MRLMKFPVTWFLFLIISFSAAVHSQPLPKPEREFRAVWIATVDNIDFPTKPALTIEQQKAELLQDLELAVSLRLNAVIFQVRPQCDALYRSEIEPWSEFLTGEMGKAQSFDPLEFLVAEAHKRGILVHAWFNPYRALHPAAKTMSENHISRRRPDLVRKYGRYLWLDPGDRRVQEYSLSVVADVVQRYDIDGVHFDDYFYPYTEKDESGKKIEFPDDDNWQKYENSGGKLSRDNWRRKNVNDFIEAVGREIKESNRKSYTEYRLSESGNRFRKRKSPGLTLTPNFMPMRANGCRMERLIISRPSFTGNGAERSIFSRAARLVEIAEYKETTRLAGNRDVSHRLERQFHR